MFWAQENTQYNNLQKPGVKIKLCLPAVSEQPADNFHRPQLLNIFFQIELCKTS